MTPPRPRISARPFRFNPAQRAAVISAYEAGQSMGSLTREYGVKRDSMSNLLRRAGTPIRQRPVISKADIDEAVRLYDSGLSLVQIGARLGWNHQTIYQQLKKRGVRLRGPSDHQRDR